MTRFNELGINKNMIKVLQSQGITEPTPVQERAIPSLLTGKDIVAQAQTGTGKTLAFVLPILEKIGRKQKHIQALIITPTRELAIQVTAEVKKLIKHLEEVNVLAVYGGQDVERQMKKLKGGSQIVVGTPGRLLDHMRRGTVKLSNLSMLVLDEADQMLHMGFLGEVEEVIRQTPSKRQTMLFSATIPGQIRNLATRYMQRPEDIRIKGTQITVDEVQQRIIETTDRTKQETLFQLIDQFRPFLAIIFCRTKRRASKLNEALKENGYDSDELHGDLSQSKREQVMKRFREAKIQLLVATDVAARGLDVEGVTHVFNYDIPQDAESYIHRIGRTGRAGDYGLALTLVTPKGRRNLELIEKGISQRIDRKSLNQPRSESKKKKPSAQKGTEQRNSKPDRQKKAKPAIPKKQKGKPNSRKKARNRAQNKPKPKARRPR